MESIGESSLWNLYGVSEEDLDSSLTPKSKPKNIKCISSGSKKAKPSHLWIHLQLCQDISFVEPPWCTFP